MLIFLESKTDENDILTLPKGYSYHAKHRSKFCKRSGGIIIVFKDKLKSILNFPKTESEFVQWVVFDNNCFEIGENVLLGCVYVPPEHTKYASNDAFNEIEKEMLTMCKKFDCTPSLVGDFNAKTKLLNDIVIPDDSLINLLNEFDDDSLIASMYDYQILNDQNIPLERSSSDLSGPNNFGYKLIEFCKRNSLYIGNGRLPGSDFKIGHTTCNNVSLVDYFILSSKVFALIKQFAILDYNPLFSDVHCALCFQLYASLNIFTTNSIDSKTPAYRKWIPEQKNRFVNVITDDVTKLNEIDNLLSDNQSGDPRDIVNTAVEKICELFTNTAKNVFSVRANNRTKRKQNDEVWFTNSCRINRKQFHKARKQYNLLKNKENRDVMKKAAKKYKNEMSKCHRQFQHKLESDLRKKSKKDSREFWKILRRLDKGSKQNVDITIEQLYDYFKKLNENTDDEPDDIDIDELFDNIENEDEIIRILDRDISEDEILTAVKNLKNNKAPGDDELVNEYIKSTVTQFLHIYVKLFNLVFESGKIPTSWLTGVIKPVYKNKGDPNNLDNYRAICLTSNLGKVYTSILNARLNKLSDEIGLITDAQGGFRKGYSVQDNMFILQSLISIYLSSGKKLFCTFIDFRKAFDTVWRIGLWQKLAKSKIGGRMFKSILSLYTDIKSCVQHGDMRTDFFTCELGVRQGEKLSPFLFALYLNDLEEFLISKSVNDLTFFSDQYLNHLNVYIKLFILFYADDTVLFAESADEMQVTLNYFEDYCNQWRLSVNVSKTKVVIFSNRKYNRDISFKLCNQDIEIKDSYTYLGLLFNYNGNFYQARKRLVDQAQKALYALYRKIQNISIPVDLQLKLFDSLVVPILTYSSEIWGFENKAIIEKVHLQFCKRILGLRSSTPNFMIYGELGRYPLELGIKQKMLNFWCKLVKNPNKLSGKLYKLILHLQEYGTYQSKWLSYVKSIFDDSGFSEVWNVQQQINVNFVKINIRQRLQDQFIQKWFGDINNSSRGEFYSSFKTDFKFEPYLLKLDSVRRSYICKLRTCNIKFPVETGRWRNIPKNDRICNLCMTGLGDEFHYICLCTHDDIVNLRRKFVPDYYYKYPHITKIYYMLKYCNVKVLTKLSMFIQKIEKIVIQ